MALTPLKAGGKVKRGIKGGGNDGGVVKAQVASEVGLGGAGSGGRWWRRGRARSGQR
jgi:hypothetical protein